MAALRMMHPSRRAGMPRHVFPAGGRRAPGRPVFSSAAPGPAKDLIPCGPTPPIHVNLVALAIPANCYR